MNYSSTQNGKTTSLVGTIPEDRFYICKISFKGCAPDIEYPSIEYDDVTFPITYETTLRIEASRSVPIRITEQLADGSLVTDLNLSAVEHFAIAAPKGIKVFGGELKSGVGIDTNDKLVSGYIESGEEALSLPGFRSSNYAVFHMDGTPVHSPFPVVLRGQCRGVIVAEGIDVCFRGILEAHVTGIVDAIDDIFGFTVF